MKRIGSAPFLLMFLAPVLASAQIDPYKRDLIQMGYSGALEGRQPFSGYAFYYHNQPDFVQNTNLTLRLAVAPTYVDSELGVLNGIGDYTDIGIGAAGGAFADSYNEIDGGTYIPAESFDGYGGEMSFSIYHLFDPGRLIPLSLVFRLTPHYSAYGRNDTAADFALPADHLDGCIRTGLRFGGVEPTLFPALAMELSIWYEGHYRSDSGYYGYATDPYHLNFQSHLFWSEAALSYTFPNRQNVYIRLTAGTSSGADRFSAYRLGSFLPLIAEFPLSLPGYFYQEISAKQFILLNANYLVPIDKKSRWELAFNASTAVVDYLPGTGQSGSSLSGVAGGLLWHSPTDRLKVMVNYAYGIDAIRNGHRGANSVGFLLQLDLGKPGHVISVTQPGLWQGIQRILP